MNAIQHALKEVMFEIPIEILESLFITPVEAQDAYVCGEVINLE